MLAGHYGLAFALKGGTRTRWSLTTLIAATWLADLFCFAFTLVGVERSQFNPSFTRAFPFQITYAPYSHGLLGAAGTSLIAALVFAKRKGFRDAALLAAAIFSHYVCDVVVHGPDMAIVSGNGPKIGFALWNHLLIAETLECGMLLAGVALYLRATKARDATGRIGFFVFAAVVAGLNVAMPWLPPPPSPQALAVGSLVLLVVGLLLSAWLERHREPLAP